MSDHTPSQPQSGPIKKAQLGRYWREILANIPDAVSVYEVSGHIVFANDMAIKDQRFSRVDHLIPDNLTDLAGRYLIHDQHEITLGLDELPTRRALKTMSMAEDTLHCVAVHGTEDFWVVAKAFPIITKRGGLKFVVSTYHEITTYKEAEAQLRESNRRMLTILDDLMQME
jgi:PAS domain-containing protein